MPFDILDKQELVPTIHLMNISAPRIARKAQPGQFVILRIDEKGERIPLHHHDYEHEIFIIEGTGNVLSPGGAKPVAYGNFASIPTGEEHGFENIGDAPFRFLCVIPKQ